MACYPANISSTPVDIVGFQIKYPLHCRKCMSEISANGMHYSFGLAGCPRGVECKQGVFRIQAHRVTIGTLGRHHVVPPDVAPLSHFDSVAGAAYYKALGHRGSALQCEIDIVFKHDLLTAPPAGI